MNNENTGVPKTWVDPETVRHHIDAAHRLRAEETGRMFRALWAWVTRAPKPAARPVEQG